MRYEYQVLTRFSRVDRKTIVSLLNRCSDDGWEVVSVSRDDSDWIITVRRPDPKGKVPMPRIYEGHSFFPLSRLMPQRDQPSPLEQKS